MLLSLSQISKVRKNVFHAQKVFPLSEYQEIADRDQATMQVTFLKLTFTYKILLLV